MPDEKNNENPKVRKHDDMWDYIKDERRRKNIADNLRAERRKKSPLPEKHSKEEDPLKDVKND